MSDLLPCPFCGGSAIIDDIEIGPDDRVFYSVACGKCNALIDQNYWYDLESEAIAAWNTRATGWQPLPTPPEGE